MDSSIFIEGCKSCKNSIEILNWYRNVYHTESQNTEQGIMSLAINDIFIKAKKLGILEDLNIDNKTLQKKDVDNKSISTHWLFIMDDDSTYGTTTDDFKTAIIELSDYTGLKSQLFNKCINGFINDDIDGLIQLFNQFSYYNIKYIYDVKKKLWG